MRCGERWSTREVLTTAVQALEERALAVEQSREQILCSLSEIVERERSDG